MQVILDFLMMGGYAAFVWPAYAVAMLVLAGLSWHSLRAHRRRQRELAQLQRRGNRRGRAP
jgi:heme exporter protein D